MKTITAYTDGSAVVKGKCVCEKETCSKCQRLGGIGAYIQYNGEEIFLSKGYKNTTISRMEQRAILATIQKIPKSLECKLIIWSDSQFIVNSFNKGWLDGWKRDNFLGRKNADLWKQILEELDNRIKMKFEINHTRGHRKDLENPIALGNFTADELCDYKIHDHYNEDNKNKLYYYYHAESDALWSSYKDIKEEGNPDGCTEPINHERAVKLAKEIGYSFNELGEITEEETLTINEDDIPF